MRDVLDRLARLESWYERVDEKLDAILEQSTKTNGTVREHSEWRCAHMAECQIRGKRFEDHLRAHDQDAALMIQLRSEHPTVMQLLKAHESTIQQANGMLRFAVAVSGLVGTLAALLTQTILHALKVL